LYSGNDGIAAEQADHHEHHGGPQLEEAEYHEAEGVDPQQRVWLGWRTSIDNALDSQLRNSVDREELLQARVAFAVDINEARFGFERKLEALDSQTKTAHQAFAHIIEARISDKTTELIQKIADGQNNFKAEIQANMSLFRKVFQDMLVQQVLAQNIPGETLSLLQNSFDQKFGETLHKVQADQMFFITEAQIKPVLDDIVQKCKQATKQASDLSSLALSEVKNLRIELVQKVREHQREMFLLKAEVAALSRLVEQGPPVPLLCRQLNPLQPMPSR